MSDQTPPSGQPTPPPEEGAGSGVDAEAGATAASPPPPPSDTATDTATGDAPAPTPPPSRKSRTRLIVAGVAALVVLALIAGGAFFLVKELTGAQKHAISIPATAGGMKRDKAKESELEQQITAIETQFKSQASSKSVVYVKSGLYNQDDSKRGPKGILLFLGAKVESAETNPAKFVKDFKTVAKANELEVTDISAGKGGGKAVCATTAAEAAQANVICAWATHDSTGELLPSVPGYDAQQLAKIMRDVRPDVEKTS